MKGQSEQIGVGDLSMSHNPFSQLFKCVGDGEVVGPKAVTWQIRVGLKHGHRILRGKGPRRKCGIGQDSNQSILSDRTGGPAISGVPGKPDPCPFMGIMLGPSQRDQHIRIKQEDRHQISSSSNSFTRALETRGPSDGRSTA